MNVKYIAFTLLYAIGSCALVSCTAPSDRGVEVSLVFSGEEAGFIEPCGCALAQFGGLARRATAIAELRSTGQPLLLVHNGGVISEPGWQQELKLETALAAMAEMGYVAMNLGVGEVSLGVEFLQTREGEAPAEPLPLLAANLRWEGSAKSPLPPFEKGGRGGFAFPGWVIREISGVRIGIVGVMSIERAKEAQTYDPSLTWTDPAEAARQALNALRSESAMQVLLFHGTLEDAASLAQQVPGYAAVVAQGGEQPLVEAQQIGETLLVTPGEKGKWLCALRLETGKGRRNSVSRDVQSLALSEDYAEDATVRALMELYHVMVKNMSQQMGVECEACHGAGGAHTAAPKTAYSQGGAKACVRCHTSETSPGFVHDRYWAKIAHGIKVK